MLLSCGSLSSWVRRLVACVGRRGCFGCAQPTPITAVDEPSKGLRIQGRSIKKRSLSEDFWSTSPHEMENSALHSRHSMSSISTAAQTNDQHAAGSSSNPNEFVNQGLLLWNQTRQQWVGNRIRSSQGQQRREPKISISNMKFLLNDLLGDDEFVVSAHEYRDYQFYVMCIISVVGTLEEGRILLGMLHTKACLEARNHLHNPSHLEMVDFLVNSWEQEGLYD
ncbi:hypothetical protein ACP70R_028732 [Stipagrostis hirtigluma subsp. patula]